MFSKILIANRGEIAVRIIRTCREMGIGTVAVYSDADRRAAHVLAADEAVHIGPEEASGSYLHAGNIIAAARSTGAAAIHPGYGFLAENASFAGQCAASGVVFIGPPPQAIEALGDKIRARNIMQDSGVPVIPGTLEAAADADHLRARADELGFPVIVKASGGGGGKGMRIVHAPEELMAAVKQAAGEAQSAFGNSAVYLEKYLDRPRHVEIQVLADTQGHAVHLLERECSIQRRYQKIIEETPSPALHPALREQMGRAAVTAIQKAGYVNAGTVEFLLTPDGAFYFLEVNTRLQVEHPITEMITGLDLVREQIRIAAGLPLSFTQADIQGRGHAIECRIYAEDPANGFFPSPGVIHYLKEPRGPGIRNDSGIYAGATVPVAYDPLLSKLVAYASDRDQAIARMVQALREYVVFGVKTTIPFLLDVLRCPAFQAGETFTHFIDTHFTPWQPSADRIAAAGIAYLIAERSRPGRQAAQGAAAAGILSPWQNLGHWRG
jgi:acetyl-CoA carboxylase, biotin carboxylase subunit